MRSRRRTPKGARRTGPIFPTPGFPVSDPLPRCGASQRGSAAAGPVAAGCATGNSPPRPPVAITPESGIHAPAIRCRTATACAATSRLRAPCGARSCGSSPGRFTHLCPAPPRQIPAIFPWVGWAFLEGPCRFPRRLLRVPLRSPAGLPHRTPVSPLTAAGGGGARPMQTVSGRGSGCQRGKYHILWVSSFMLQHVVLKRLWIRWWMGWETALKAGGMGVPGDKRGVPRAGCSMVFFAGGFLGFSARGAGPRHGFGRAAGSPGTL